VEVHVSLVGRTDLAGELYRQLRRAILDRRLRPGDPLPATRELARRLAVSRTTVTVAYDRLASEGFVSARVGAGTFVSDGVALSALDARRKRPQGALRPRRHWDSVSLHAAVGRAAAAGVAVHQLAQFAVASRRMAGIVLGFGAIQAADVEPGLRLLRRKWTSRIR
jgi:DNA-binding transcriptional MocR family regulator